MEAEKAMLFLQRLKAIAEIGLTHAESGYDLERYQESRQIVLELMSEMTAEPLQALENFYLIPDDYPTPKVDVRAFILNEEGQVLMAQESVDNKWTIPGGWADIGETPVECVLKEVEEETGLRASVIRLLAIFDKRCHPHPPRPHYVYKLIFLCEVVGGELKAGFDMKGAQFFEWNDLPELSEDRILKSQLNLLRELSIQDKPVYCD